MKKNIFVLGSTGSIGKSTLEVIRYQPEHFTAKVLVTNVNIELLLKQIEEFNPEYAVVYNKQTYLKHQSKFKNLNTKVLSGIEGILKILDETKIDVF